MFKRILDKSNLLSLGVAGLLTVGLASCAPVKFSKSDDIVVNPSDSKAIKCDPKINGTLTAFTYTSAATLPSIASNCTPIANVSYEWTVKKGSTVITTAIPGLAGGTPSSVDFRTLGEGTYQVFLKATDSTNEYKPYNATTPLKFTVPGATVEPIQITCNPKLNNTLTSVVVGPSDSNPSVTANCKPVANGYIWTVYKGAAQVTVPNFTSTASSTPNFKSLGEGEYKVYLHATHETGTYWESSQPLNVKVVGDGTPSGGEILCNPRINGSLTSLTITPSSANPLISSNCNPTSVQYSWTVTKNGTTIAVPGLAGSNSNPNFGSLGVGTYLINLTATKPGYTSWSASQPLIITVEGGGDPTLTLNCSPRLNGQFVSMSIAENGPNPTVTSGCNPSTVNHSWTVVKNGITVTLNPGVSGPSSTPNFTGAGLGTYLVYLTASATGYNTYVSPSPLEVTVTKKAQEIRHVTYTKAVTASNNKVDLLFVFDDSNSMLADNQKLAQKLQGFVNDLTASGLDWQMCATITRSQVINNVTYWGASKDWVGYLGSPKWILKQGATDPYSIFTNTVNQIGAGWANTDDERAIKAAYWHMEYAPYSNCYRSDASVAVNILSDEDERSIGGNKSFQYYWDEFKPLEFDDEPVSLVNKVKEKLGAKKNFVVNSIIVKPGDSACMASQDAGGSKSHYGYKYKELSDLTGGYTGSICDSDYSNSLYYFKDKIINSLNSIPLECAPIGDVAVQITPTMGGVTTAIVNNTLVFTPAVPAGRTITVDYDCPMN